MDLLRFITCGSVDDGKSTLIGRLLHDSGLVPDDQRAALGNGAEIDFASLLDGLEAEREQGITIDVAYRYFQTPRRSFIVADTPGHEQYTRNMATGASTAELALILVDARKGLLTQTRRHSHVARLLGIRRIVLAVNKMDLVGYARERFEEVAEEYRRFAEAIGVSSVEAVPVAALGGDNVVTPSPRMPWYSGPTILAHLETVALDEEDLTARPFRMPVQWVNRADQDFRGYSGTIAAGVARPGDPVLIAPSGKTSGIARIVYADGDLLRAEAGQSVTLTLADDVDCGRGDMIADASEPPETADQFEAVLIWMGEEAMLPGRAYRMKIGAADCGATVTDLKHEIDPDSLEQLAARTLPLNAIGTVNLALDRRIPFEPYEQNRTLGGFILIDRISNSTVAAGMIRFALRRSHNLSWQHLDVTAEARSAMKGQQPRLAWFTGLSGAGKSTIANLVERKLHALGRHTYLLDGDNVRHGLNRDLGFTDAERVENIRRVGEVARLMTDAGLIVLAAFISPFRAERRMVRDLFPPGRFIEVHVDAPLAEAERRDPKGLYAKARRGELGNFTGIDSPYEPPEAAEIRIDTVEMSAEEAAERIVAALLDD